MAKIKFIYVGKSFRDAHYRNFFEGFKLIVALNGMTVFCEFMILAEFGCIRPHDVFSTSAELKQCQTTTSNYNLEKYCDY